MNPNPLTVKEKEAAAARHKACLNIGEVWGLATTEQKRGVLEYVLEELDYPRCYGVERAINGGMIFSYVPKYKGLLSSLDQSLWKGLADEILSRGDGAFAACCNMVSGFEDNCRPVMAEMVSEGQVLEADGVSRYGGQGNGSTESH